jgi:YD repeat-containing protein
VITPDGAKSTWEYDYEGRLLTARDVNQNEQKFIYNLLGNPVKIKEADGNIRHLHYDAEENIIHAQDNHQSVAFAYSGMGRMVARTENNTTVRFVYDTEEQLIAIQNEHGSVYGFTLDAQGQVIEEKGFDELKRKYERDPAGNVVKTIRPGDRHTTYEYDAMNRVVKVTHSDGSEESYEYRADGELIAAHNQHTSLGFERDALGRVMKEVQGEYWVSSEYDALGLRSTMSSSLGALQKITRNVMGDVEKVELLSAPGVAGAESVVQMRSLTHAKSQLRD